MGKSSFLHYKKELLPVFVLKTKDYTAQTVPKSENNSIFAADFRVLRGQIKRLWQRTQSASRKNPFIQI